ncbi:VOC family protein [Haladaptatus sp. CMSO5]|uniref:VOC family protein n=1 Tax=Haladaptatus sp. CMSO5 TaxID=3120514 RepID=UPI002FCDF498
MAPTDTEAYPMPLFCQLAVSDIEGSLAWYDALGFTTIYAMPVMSHVRYRKYADIMLVADEMRVGEERPASRGSGLSIYINVENESVDDVAARAKAYGVDIENGPTDTPWNTREISVRDPDGYRVVFTEVADKARSFAEVMGDSTSESYEWDEATSAESE